MDLIEKTVEQQVLFQGSIIRVRKDTARLPNGRLAGREVVEHPGGVAILALHDDATVSVVRQFRYPFQAVITELPAGNTARSPAWRRCASWRRKWASGPES